MSVRLNSEREIAARLFDPAFKAENEIADGLYKLVEKYFHANMPSFREARVEALCFSERLRQRYFALRDKTAPFPTPAQLRLENQANREQYIKCLDAFLRVNRFVVTFSNMIIPLQRTQPLAMRIAPFQKDHLQYFREHPLLDRLADLREQEVMKFHTHACCLLQIEVDLQLGSEWSLEINKLAKVRWAPERPIAQTAKKRRAFIWKAK